MYVFLLQRLSSLAAAHAVQPLEQPARRVVGVGLEHLPLRAEHREHAPLGVVGGLEALAPVCLGVVLVGPDQPYYLAVAVIDGALHAAVPFDAPDFPVEQVVGDAGLAPLVVRDLGQIARRVVAELRLVVDAAGRFPTRRSITVQYASINVRYWF